MQEDSQRDVVRSLEAQHSWGNATAADPVRSNRGGAERIAEDGDGVDERLRTGLPRILMTQALPLAASALDPAARDWGPERRPPGE
ncbi:hypothetical protein NDU88_001912 [Pleurodeles waltl]|uniref:Uncharacterized protein n=1 Tax=Pleurodeles waltl TaxID=8319 RepID=A0AAV7MM96_PLEWA|nr:hypothetical protein NDU88_001912 [Pleurodeles waltl]